MRNAAPLLALLLLGCPVTRETSLRPLGLLTSPNKHGQYPPGACSRAKNVCMRDPGVVTSLPDVRSYRDNVTPGSGYTVRRIIPGDASLLTLNENAGTWDPRWVTGAASNAVTNFGSFTTSFATGKAHASRTRERFFVSSSIAPLVFDSEGDTTPRPAGMPPLMRLDPNTTLATTNAQVLADNKVVSYRAIWVRKQSDGYLLEGPPSNRLHLTNDSGSTGDPELIVAWDADYGLATGDIIEIYRTFAQDTGVDPGTDHRLAIAYTVTNTDISNGGATIRDTTPEAALGRQLYSDPGNVAGEIINGERTNFPPPQSDDLATFKGYTFYLSKRLPHHLIAKINGKWGSLSTAADRKYGIGTRVILGDTTNLSTTISNISATHMLGLVVGQAISGTGIPANSTIATIAGATSITISQAATATASGVTIVATDRFEINGNAGSMADWYALTTSNALLTANALVLIDQPCAVTHGGSSFLSSDMDGPSITWQAQRYAHGVIAIEATNGSNYSPALPAIGATAQDGSYDERSNRLHYSRIDQPEAVPPLNFLFVGSGSIYRLIPTRDALYVFASDGLFRLSGDGDWRVDPVDPKLVLSARNAVDVLDGAIWAYTNEGLVKVQDDAVDYVTRGRIADLVPGALYSDTWDTFLSADELHHEVWLTFRSGNAATSYLYNTLTDRFTTCTDDEFSASAYARYLQSLTFGVVSTNPDVYYFELDSSTTRMPSAELRFQPLTMGDPFSQKEFVDVDYMFEGAATALTLVPSFDGTNYTGVTVAASSIESLGRVAVPRNAPALSRRLAPGFTFSSGGTSNLWSFRGISIRWDWSSEELEAR